MVYDWKKKQDAMMLEMAKHMIQNAETWLGTVDPENLGGTKSDVVSVLKAQEKNIEDRVAALNKEAEEEPKKGEKGGEKGE